MATRNAAVHEGEEPIRPAITGRIAQVRVARETGLPPAQTRPGWAHRVNAHTPPGGAGRPRAALATSLPLKSLSVRGLIRQGAGIVPERGPRNTVATLRTARGRAATASLSKTAKRISPWCGVDAFPSPGYARTPVRNWTAQLWPLVFFGSLSSPTVSITTASSIAFRARLAS